MINIKKAIKNRTNKVEQQATTINKQLASIFSRSAEGLDWEVKFEVPIEVIEIMEASCDQTQFLSGDETDFPFLEEKLEWLLSSEKDEELQKITLALSNDPTMIGPTEIIKYFRKNWDRLKSKQVAARALYAVSKITRFDVSEDTLNEINEILNRIS